MTVRVHDECIGSDVFGASEDSCPGLRGPEMMVSKCGPVMANNGEDMSSNGSQDSVTMNDDSLIFA